MEIYKNKQTIGKMDWKTPLGGRRGTEDRGLRRVPRFFIQISNLARTTKTKKNKTKTL